MTEDVYGPIQARVHGQRWRFVWEGPGSPERQQKEIRDVIQHNLIHRIGGYTWQQIREAIKDCEDQEG